MATEKVYQKQHGQINIVLHDRQHMHVTRPEKVTEPKDRMLRYIDEKFSKYIGMDHIKETVKEIYAMITINQKREQMGLACKHHVLHMLFKGNPGTGKTSVARTLADIFYEMNYLSKGHFIEAERADLVGEYIGQTAQKTRALIQKALGGILFIDEAYSLARGGEKDFGREAIDTLVTHMENHHDDFILILAGYPYEMERFLLLNPGLRSRFPFILDFEDLDGSQLIDVAKRMATERDYKLTKEAEWKLRSHLILKAKEYHFSNARYVRNVIEDAIRKQAVRLIRYEHPTPEDLMLITASDLQFDDYKP